LLATRALNSLIIACFKKGSWIGYEKQVNSKGIKLITLEANTYLGFGFWILAFNLVIIGWEEIIYTMEIIDRVDGEEEWTKASTDILVKDECAIVTDIQVDDSVIVMNERLC